MSFDELLNQILEELREINIREKLKEIIPKNDYDRNLSEIKDLLENISEKLDDINEKYETTD
jgi:predicted transcriptional regulator